MLKRFGINLKTLDAEKLRSDYNALHQKKATLQQTYKSAERKISGLNQILDNLGRYLERTPGQQAIRKKPDKNAHSL